MEINTNNCLNLCDISEFSFIEKIICNIKNNYKIERIYIGSYFCDNFFLYSNYLKLIEILNNNFKNSVKITLVVPVSTEKNLEKIKEKISEIVNYNTEIEEITVNDLGMLIYIYNNYSIKINMGRIFSKDYRDPRYVEYFNEKSIPKFYTENFISMIKKYNINSVELDITNNKLDLSNFKNIIIGIHTEYTYMTTGKICENSSVNKKIYNKFRPNDKCNFECNSMCMCYDFKDLRTWVKIGKTIFFENNSYKIENNNEKITERFIYFPLSDVLKNIN